MHDILRVPQYKVGTLCYFLPRLLGLTKNWPNISSRFQWGSKPCGYFHASMADRGGTIPESAFKVIYISSRIVTVDADQEQIWVGVLYGTAILAASMRTVFRIYSHRRLFLDDAFLLLACATLTAAISTLYIVISPLHLVQEPGNGGSSSQIHLYQVLRLTHRALVWTAIFSVKFSFLYFFRQIVERIQSLMRHWKVVGMTNIVACAFCVCFSFTACPRTDSAAGKWSQSRGDLHSFELKSYPI